MESKVDGVNRTHSQSSGFTAFTAPLGPILQALWAPPVRHSLRLRTLCRRPPVRLQSLRSLHTLFHHCYLLYQPECSLNVSGCVNFDMFILLNEFPFSNVSKKHVWGVLSEDLISGLSTSNIFKLSKHVMILVCNHVSVSYIAVLGLCFSFVSGRSASSWTLKFS